MSILYIKQGNVFVPVPAIQGPPGNLDNLTRANVESVLIGDITSHNHSTQIAAVLTDYVLKVAGMGLSTNDFTDALLTKLNGLSNYDDTTISSALTTLQNQLNTLVSGNASTAIESFNEITSFLANVTDSETLEGILAGLNTTIANSLTEAKAYSDAGINTHNTSNTAHQDIRDLIPNSIATESVNGLMSSTDKTKLNAIEAEANKYILPTASSTVKGGIKVGDGLTLDGEILKTTPIISNLAYESIATITSPFSIVQNTDYNFTLSENWDQNAVYIFRMLTWDGTTPYSYQNILVFGNQINIPIGYSAFISAGATYREFEITTVNANIITIRGTSTNTCKIDSIYKLK